RSRRISKRRSRWRCCCWCSRRPCCSGCASLRSGPGSMLTATLDRRLGASHLEVALEVPIASTLVLVGESGSGKTTVLRLLAGPLEPDAGRIALDGPIWFDAASRIDVPAADREVGWVPQDYALFPHLSVAENVAFGLKASGIAREEVRKRVARALERF